MAQSCWRRRASRVSTRNHRLAAIVGCSKRSSSAEIVRPALVAVAIVFVYELVVFVALSVVGIEAFAFFLSRSTEIAAITAAMWRRLDFCYIFYAISQQLAVILLATAPRYFLYQALVTNLGWMVRAGRLQPADSTRNVFSCRGRWSSVGCN